VVFEDLQLADFGNRIPTLSFEVFADDGAVELTTILADLLPEAVVLPVPGAVAGYSVEAGSIADTVDTIGEVVPIACTALGDGLQLGSADPADAMALVLPEAVAGGTDNEPGSQTGFSRQREPLPGSRLTAIRYYDVARDFQPGIQRGRGRALPGDTATIEFPAALGSPAARELADAASQRAALPRDRATYRVATIDPALVPGAIARLPGASERWQIDEWEWSAQGVELRLRALPHRFLGGGTALVSDPGRANVASDLPAAATVLAALELPWDGNGAGNSPALYAAAGAATAGWRGAALFARHPDGSLTPLGPTGRNRAIIGTAVNVLASRSPLALDRASAVEIVLVAADQILAPATLAQLAMGANRALLGDEIIQFAGAESLGSGRWRLRDLLRGRGGTEGAVAGHAAGEMFVLLDDALVPVEPELVGDAAHAVLAASGLADEVPRTANVALAGATLRPLSPVHGSVRVAVDGSVALAWTRRGRGAWLWSDGVDAPLSEQSEAYVVTLGDVAAPLAVWETAEPMLTLSAAAVTQLAAPGAPFAVRQRGSRALSQPLVLGALA
ncbi:MAG: phage tail protein, partial [Novosphingobium sp.]